MLVRFPIHSTVQNNPCEVSWFPTGSKLKLYLTQENSRFSDSFVRKWVIKSDLSQNLSWLVQVTQKGSSFHPICVFCPPLHLRLPPNGAEQGGNCSFWACTTKWPPMLNLDCAADITHAHVYGLGTFENTYRPRPVDRISHRKWRETKEQLIWLPDLALLGCC